MIPRTGPALAAVVAALALVPASAPASRAHTAAYRTCHMSAHDAQHMGASYILDGQYKVQAVSCAEGKKVIRAFHACRRAHGGAKRGRCPVTASVLGFHCREAKRTVYGGVLSGAAICRRGNRKVFHNFSNFL